ncbi:MAG: YdiU family protein, partial [Acidimicrobiia bacterium]|nr:YdiU family protein [Acidimicrobiia bacterium]
AGNLLPAGAEPVAMAYAGHQFGGYSPRLGDGRALLLGEVVDTSGRRVDLHLKGSGRTPFSRGGDGKATVGPMLREFLMAEAMNGLGIPTGRALAVVTTGEQIMRQGPEPGAVLTRVASSHLRVGTFEYAVRLEDPTVLKRLADYAIDRHYREAVDEALAATGQGRYVTLLDSVVTAQADLVAQWMLVGFIHGVMNTDNTTISGETVDYGPCAFMDRYDPATVYSSIDHQGRYAYGNQPGIAHWNLTRLAETLLPLMAEDSGQEAEAMIPVATEVLDSFQPRFQARFRSGMLAKIGLAAAHGADPGHDPGGDNQDGPGRDGLIPSLLGLLHRHRVDYTSFFRSLATAVASGDDGPVRELVAASATDGSAGVDGSGPVESWLADWRRRLDAVDRDRTEVAAGMNRVNPLYIPRNHRVEEALQEANRGDLSLFRELLSLVSDPYTERPAKERFAEPAPEGFDQTFRTFCGT